MIQTAYKCKGFVKTWPGIKGAHTVYFNHNAAMSRRRFYLSTCSAFLNAKGSLRIKQGSNTWTQTYHPEILSAKQQRTSFYKSYITYEENKLLFRRWDFPRVPNLKLFIDVLLICFPCVNTRLWVVPSPNSKKTILSHTSINTTSTDERELCRITP